ncbi:ABC transporter ATP-binding protein [Abyssicoccus albus]|uniref:ATP-binding cassette subfamily B protein n=1 Tax=Abyssicoccus albus TaxID=1817405 RepID=A0A3N5C779_9BACL|nr:ABC transporter ATP-binding protein [Abyssicoccus albus]RPF58208.1 ATP-binding cassette subfamily B protein [Abyssicoccus albus]
MKHFRRLMHYMTQYKTYFIVGIILLIFAVITELTGPLVAMHIIDEHIKNSDGSIQLDAVFKLLLLYLTIMVVFAVLSYFQMIFIQLAGSNAIKSMRIDLFKHVQKLPIQYFDNLPAGKVVARITNDTQTILELFTIVIPAFISGAFTVTGITVAIFFLSPKAGVMVLIIVPMVVIWMYLYRKITNQYNHEVREKNSEMNAMLNESINGMTIIQAFNQEQKIQQEYDAMNASYLKNYTKIIRMDSMSGHTLMDSVRSIIFAILIYIFGINFLSETNAFTVGMMYVLVDYVTRLFNPLFDIINQFQVMQQAAVSSERVFEMMDSEEEVERPHKSLALSGYVHIKDVSFSYKPDEYVLRDINIEAMPGETVALVGHTGSGKSSIMNLLFRFYDVTDGEIYYDDYESRDVSKQSIRQHMAIVLQDPYLYSGTILSNITLDDPTISEQDALQAIYEVGGRQFIEQLTDGIHTEVTERGATFSSGERQLISFARALAFNPKILILDEATSHVDSETEQMIQQAMSVLSKGRTTFMIAHRLSTIQHADEIIVLNKGQIVERGKHQELMNLDGYYKEMYELQGQRNE